MWRPEGWIEGISFEEISKITPCLVSMMTIKEKKIFEAGADAMLKLLREQGSPTMDSFGEGPYTSGVSVFIPDDTKKGN